MSIDDDILELLSRGLDADLSRVEMRRLYRLVAEDDDVRAEAGALARMEEDFAGFAAELAQARPSSNLSEKIRHALTEERAHNSGPKKQRTGFWGWLHSPHGISMQPLSFVSGLAVAALAWVFLTPTVAPLVLDAPKPKVARFQVSDMHFKRAEAEVDWTYQFIVMPNGATRVALDQGDDLTMHFQFETTEPTPLTVAHHVQGRKKPQLHSFSVDGIGFADLKDPLPGDTLVVHNNGQVPVVVYAFTNGYGGSWVLPAKVDEGKSL